MNPNKQDLIRRISKANGGEESCAGGALLKLRWWSSSKLCGGRRQLNSKFSPA